MNVCYELTECFLSGISPVKNVFSIETGQIQYCFLGVSSLWPDSERNWLNVKSASKGID